MCGPKEVPIIHFQRRRQHPSPSPGESGRSQNMQCSLQWHLSTLLSLTLWPPVYSVWLRGFKTYTTGSWEFPWCSGCCGLCPDLPSGLRPSFPPWVSLKTALSWRELPLQGPVLFPRVTCIQRLVHEGCKDPASLPQWGTTLQDHLQKSVGDRLRSFTDFIEVQFFSLSSPTPLIPQHMLILKHNPIDLPYTNLHHRVFSREPDWWHLWNSIYDGQPHSHFGIWYLLNWCLSQNWERKSAT